MEDSAAIVRETVLARLRRRMRPRMFQAYQLPVWDVAAFLGVSHLYTRIAVLRVRIAYVRELIREVPIRGQPANVSPGQRECVHEYGSGQSLQSRRHGASCASRWRISSA